MSIKSLSQDIYSEVEEKKQDISSFYEEELKNLDEELQAEVEEYRKSLSNQYESELANSKSSILGSAQSQATSKILKAKQTLNNKIKEEAIAQLTNIDEKQKISLYKKLLKQVEEQLELGIIECSSNDKKLLEEIVSKQTKIETNKNMLGGFKAYSQDKKQAIDVTFSTLLEEVFEESKQE